MKLIEDFIADGLQKNKNAVQVLKDAIDYIIDIIN